MRNNTPQAPLIAHVIYTLGTGGLENGLVNIINRCPPTRYRHVIICLDSAQHFAARLSVVDVDILELHKKPGHDLGMYWRLWRELVRLRPAIIHTRNLAALETQILGLLMPGCKRVHGEHGRDMHDIDGSNRKYQWLRRLLNPLIHHFIAVSRDLSRWLVDTVHIPEAKVTQIYNGVDTQRFTPHSLVPACRPEGLPESFQPHRDSLVIGTVGRLVKVKDQQLLLVALYQLLREQPALRGRLRLLMVGAGPEHHALCELAKRLALTELVWMTGDRDDIPELLSCMDIFVLPSLGEGISNTLLEAMACGLPVIASQVGGNPELVEAHTSGLLFPPGDVTALCRALATLIDDPTLRERLGQAAQARIRQGFNWQLTVDSYLRVYDKLLYAEAVAAPARGH